MLDRKSFSGYVVILAGGVVSWKCQKQQTVALSTQEAEYVALSNAAKEAIWFGYFLTELGQGKYLGRHTIIHADNQSAIFLAENDEVSDRSKHIDLKHHFIKDAVKKGVIELQYVPSKDNVVDLLTKGLNGRRVQEILPKLGMK